MVAELSTRIGNLHLRNPIMPASGTFSDDLAEVIDISRIGAHVLKTVTPDLRGGNATPRVCEIRGAMLNSIGIPSKGLKHLLKTVIPWYARFDVPLVVSISANDSESFARSCEKVSQPGVAAIEANISCPNIEEDGRAFAMRPESTHTIMTALRGATDLPLWAKLSPNTGEPAEVGLAAEAAGADALVVANTVLGMAVDIHSRKPRLGNIMGGISGPPIKPIALRMTYQCARSVRIPVIGCGGVSTVEDVLEYLIVGASAVQVGTATFINPSTMTTLVDQLSAWMQENGVDSLDQIIGTLRDDDVRESEQFMETVRR